MDRREFVKAAVTTGVAGSVLTSADDARPAPAIQNASDKKRPPFRLIYEAEWNDVPCSEYPITPDTWVKECFRPLKETQVDALFYNLCSSDGYVCELKNGQILMDNFEQLGDAWVWRYRENTKRLIEADANPPKVAVREGRALGLTVIPIVRMNDPHDMFFKYEVSDFKLKNKHLLLGHGTYTDFEKGASGYPNPPWAPSMERRTWGMFDFAHQEVRDHKLAIINEFITRWDNDGMSLDFDRDPKYFREDGKAENTEKMTELLRKVRGILDRQSKRRGRPQYLHVRVIPRIDVCLNRGLDVKTWVEEGLVDAITPGAGYLTLGLDLSPWLDLVDGRNCWIYPANNHWKTPAETRAWAKVMYSRGAPGLYLFNWGHLLHGFDSQTRPVSHNKGSVPFDELNPIYYDALNEIGRQETMAYKDTTYRLDVDKDAFHQKYRAIDGFVQLPAKLDVGKSSYKLPFVEDLEGAVKSGLAARGRLRLKITNYTHPDEIDVSLNGHKLDDSKRTARPEYIMNNNTWLEYPVDLNGLTQGVNELTLDVRLLNPQMSVTPELIDVELVVEYQET